MFDDICHRLGFEARPQTRDAARVRLGHSGKR